MFLRTVWLKLIPPPTADSSSQNPSSSVTLEKLILEMYDSHRKFAFFTHKIPEMEEKLL